MSKRPNILFLLADDQRYNTIGALGNDEIKTPNLDKLVERGCAFTNAHIPGGTTGAICMPSRAMINTGRTLFHIEGEGQNIPCEHITLGEALKQEGYQTIGIGKWHNGLQGYTNSFINGENIFFGGMWDHWNVPVFDYDKTGKYDHQAPFVTNFFNSNETINVRCQKVNTGVHSTELIAGSAMNFINEYDSEDPFYLYVSFLAPHDPRTMPQEYKNMYDPETISLPESFCEEHIYDYGIKDMRDERLAAYPRNPKEIKRHIADYYAMISHLDDAVGRIVTTLQENHLLDNTIIIFSGDNGLGIGNHGLMGKQNLYDHSIRVPLLFSGPNIPHVKCDGYAYLMDIYPTLCDLIDTKIPESVEGISLMPIMNGTGKGRESLYFAYQDRIRGVKDERYKLIEYRYQDLCETQLFDLQNDPNELDNLHGKQEYAETEHHLRILLEEYRNRWDDEKSMHGKVFWERF